MPYAAKTYWHDLCWSDHEMNDKNFVFTQEEAANVLLKTAELVEKSLEPAFAINEILKLLSDKLQLKKGRVILLNEDGLLKIAYSIGLSSQEQERGIYAVGEGVTGQVLATAQVAIIHDISKEPSYLAKVKDVANFSDSELAYIAVPIKQNKKPIGVFAFHLSPNEKSNFTRHLFVIEILSVMIGQILSINQVVKAKTQELIQENLLLKSHHFNAADYGILGESSAIRDSIQLALKTARSNATVLISGESGCGKEKFARMLHIASDRRDKAFVCINCAAIPGTLLESELFGHEKGSFTNADKKHIGKFEMANQGTIFLDEIGDMPVDLQVKLLRVLQEQTVTRIGGSEDIPINIRIITATNKNLKNEIKSGHFRLDLFYRLNVVNIHLPALRERAGDIRLLALYFIQRENQKYGINKILSEEALGVLEQYDWPGNIRQLENVIERSAIIAESEVISGEFLQSLLQQEQDLEPAEKKSLPAKNGDSTTLVEYRPYIKVSQHEKQRIENALLTAGGNKTQAAKILGLTPRQLYYRLDKLGIDLQSGAIQ